MMLGVYDYTVVLTYVSVLISMGGMLFSMNGYPRMVIREWRLSVWHCQDFVICLTARLPGRKKIVLKWRKSLEFRLIRWQILSVLVWVRH